MIKYEKTGKGDIRKFMFESLLTLDGNILLWIQEYIRNGMPVFGTCAGLILLAKQVEQNESHLATMDISVKRNAYGRQLGSFYTEGEFAQLGTIPMEFIRAPYIESADDDVEILSVTDGNITGIRYKNQLAVSFHPELCDDDKIYKYFLKM